MIAAVGLMGKILGPVGMVWLIRRGAWPLSALVLCVTNDFIWWIPLRCTCMTRGWCFAKAPNSRSGAGAWGPSASRLSAECQQMV